MMQKQILRPDRLRQVPAQFSWIDQRLVREQFLRRADPPAWTLYLALVTVADAQGLSYYSDPTLGRLLKLDGVQLAQGRRQLQQADLVAYQKPFYQVLALPDATVNRTPESSRLGQSLSVGDILRRATGGAQ
jgi:hypothetical protein